MRLLKNLSFFTSAVGLLLLVATPTKAQDIQAGTQENARSLAQADLSHSGAKGQVKGPSSTLTQLLSSADAARPLSASQGLALSELMRLSEAELNQLEAPAAESSHQDQDDALQALMASPERGDAVSEAASAPRLEPLLAQTVQSATEALTEEGQQVLPPGTPINTQILYERTQNEAEGVIDEQVIRRVPDPALLREQLTAYKIQVAPVGEAQVQADRRSTVLIGGSVTDADGNVLDNDIVVTLSTSAGEFISADYDIDRAGFQVLARRGEFTSELRSSLDAQRVVVRASAARDDLLSTTPLPLPDNLVDGPREIDAYTEITFTTNLRPSLVTGVIDLRWGPASTDLWSSFSDFLRPEDIGKTEFSARTAVFATGALGDWLFTGAYNSDLNLNERCDNLGTALYNSGSDCSGKSKYPVYGDSSSEDFLTPSQDSLYLRFQQDASVVGADPNFFMWGDYSTNEFSRPSQLFTATSRQLHGFMGNYTFGSGNSGLQLTAMYADNIRPFKRDTIVPDGTSGYYFLSEPLVLAGSEEIYIEVEELNRPGTVVERVALSRGADYRIDYDRGAILFTQPVTITDANPFGRTLVRRIVASYQVEGEETGGELFGGRAQYNFSYDIDSPSWIGASVITEDNNNTDFTLYGVDALFSLGDYGQLIAEYAQSSLDGANTGFNSGDGSAYRIEARGEFTDNISALAYLRGADSEFSNNATTSFRPGQTRWGAEVSALVGKNTLLDFSYDQEENRGTAPAVLTGFDALRNPGFFAAPGAEIDNSLTTIRAGIQQQIGAATVDLAYLYRDREDRTFDDLDFSGSQLVSGLTLPLASNLSFRAQNELNLGGGDDLVYPDRTVLGLDYTPIPEVTVRLAQQFFGSSDVAPDSITSLDTLLNYDITDNTQLTGRYSVLGGYKGLVGQGAVGLNHRWNIAPGLNVDLGYERVVGEGLGVIGTGERFSQPFAVGQSAAALGIVPGSTYSAGIEYIDNSSFQASARAEFRDSDSNGDNTVLTAALAGKLSPALTALARYEYANYANQTLTERFGDTSSLRVGMAYRNPYSDKFNALLSYEYATNPGLSINSTGDEDIDEHTLAAEAIYAPNYRWEFYGKYGLRYTNASLASLGVGDVSNTIHLAQMRTTYRLGYRWDLAGEIRYVSQPSINFDETAFAVETGYYITPDLRMGVGYSFGAANDRSFQGSGYRDDDGFYVGATFKVNELFNGFGLQDPAPVQQTESLVSDDEVDGQGQASPTSQGDRTGLPDAELLIFGGPQVDLAPSDGSSGSSSPGSDGFDSDGFDSDGFDSDGSGFNDSAPGGMDADGSGTSGAGSEGSGSEGSGSEGSGSEGSGTSGSGVNIPIVPGLPSGSTGPAPGSPSPGSTSPGMTAPDSDVAPSGTVPGSSAPGSTTPDGTSPGSTSPGSTSPDGAFPGSSDTEGSASDGSSGFNGAGSDDAGSEATPAPASEPTPASEPIRGLW
ncbi:MAG: TonB-dependent receptor [Cyanobacteria bacterium J06634_5]